MRDATEAEAREWWAILDNAKPGDTVAIPGRLTGIALPVERPSDEA